MGNKPPRESVVTVGAARADAEASGAEPLMRIVTSSILACLFVFLAGFNVWNMLSRGRSAPGTARLWTQIHRIVGYAFVALFGIFVYFMLLRIKGSSDELSPRLIIHAACALALAPLLFVKVIVARYQKAERALLTALGVTIFSGTFTLVAVNLSIHFLRDASAHKVSGTTSMLVVGGVLASALAAFLIKSKQPLPNSAMTSTAPVERPTQRSGGNPEVLELALAHIEPQTHDAKTLRFLLPPNSHLAARPGQFLAFEWLVNGKPVTRCYSICSSPAQTAYIEITPKRVENGCVSVFVNDRATVGLRVKARGPYGKFYFDETKHKRIVLIAGGSGITPMIAMLRYINDLCIPVPTTLIYCVRTERDIFFHDEMVRLERRLREFRSALVLSQPGAGWLGYRGRLTRDVLEREVSKPLDSTFFLCGPPAFMDATRALLRDMGVDPARILQESFGGSVTTGNEFAEIPGAAQVRFARSGATLRVSRDETLLQCAEANGVLIPSGCRQGQCGTCATRLLSGIVRMEREDALTNEMRSEGFILPCVSRPETDVSLDA